MGALTATWLVAVLAGTVRREWVHDWRFLRLSAMLLVVAVVALAMTLAPAHQSDLEISAFVNGLIHAVGLALLLLAYWPRISSGEETAEQERGEGRSD